MTDIAITDVTNSTDGNDGTGVFDVLMGAVERHIQEQFDAGRIEGADFATVYLGSLKEVLQNSIQFVMTEQKSGLEADVLTQQIIQEGEKTDLIIAQTAKVYEEIAASQADTTRKNLLNNKQVAKVQADTDLVIEKEVTESKNSITPTAGILGAKHELITAQTLGFKNDTKQKVLKLMLDGYAVNLSISGTANIPETVQDAAIDQMSQDILDSLDVTPIVIQSTPQVPDVGD